MVFKVGLIGCGRIAKKHAEVLTSGKESRLGIGGCCDLIQDKAQKLCSEYRTRHFQTMHDLAASDDIDIITILSESGLHTKHIEELSRYKKPIIVEKPIGLRVDKVRSAIASCRQNGSELFVVKQNRFNQPVQALIKAVESNKLGDLFMGTIRVRWRRGIDYYKQADWRGTWLLDGGVLTNQAIHHVDLLRYLMGPVESVYAYSSCFRAPIEAEDSLVAVIRFKNGALGTIEATTATEPVDLEGSISILGSKGSIEIGGFALNKIQTWNIAGREEEIDLADINEVPANVYGFGHSAFYSHVCDVLEGKSSNTLSGEEGLKSLELVNWIYRSIEERKEISIDAKADLHSMRLGR